MRKQAFLIGGPVPRLAASAAQAVWGWRPRWPRGVLASLVATTLLCAMAPVPAAGKPVAHRVIVNADGSFSPSRTLIRDGDIVEWVFAHRTDTIIPVNNEPFPEICTAYKSYDSNNPNDFTGGCSARQESRLAGG